MPASTDVSRWESRGGGSSAAVRRSRATGPYSWPPATATIPHGVLGRRRRARRQDPETEGLLHAGEDAVHQLARDVFVRRKRTGRRGQQGRPDLRAGCRRTRRRDTNAARQIVRGRRRLGALSTFQDVGGARWILAAAAGGPHGCRQCGQWRDRGVQTGRSRRRAGAAARLGVARSRLAGDSHVREWRGLCAVERRSASHRAAADERGAVRTGCRHGKALWDSGTTIASPVHAIGPAVDDSQVYVVTTDGTLYPLVSL